MKQSQENFLQLVAEAYNGTLQLPAFQRDWKWERSKVISLYDSIRKQFPIGSFLFLEASSAYDLSPRPYEGSSGKTNPIRLTLDGQQRITSGIVLLHGSSDPTRYFLKLDVLRKLTEAYISDSSTVPGLDYRNDEQVNTFVQEIDDNDDYMLATSRKTDLSTLLLQHHLLSSTYLTNKISIQKALEPYEDKYPETKDFLKWVVVPYFTFENSANYPVTTLTAAESLSAVTKIFSTINTTGKKLTPIEIVTAVLFSHDINLKQQVREFHQASDYLSNMDIDGETLLQTIALLANKSPKKSMLPKTITHERFKAYYGDALDLLDRVGQCLTSELGVGFKDTDKLIPYSSILAPMAVCFEEIKKLKGNDKSKALDKIHKWFIGAAIGQRYIQGAGSKQESDARDMKKWIKESKPSPGPKWLDTVHLTKEMVRAPTSGAVAKLVRCLINREKPIDPLELTKIGYYEYADYPPEEHHIWPKRFCSDHIPDWDSNVDTAEHAMNIMPVSHKTNKKWSNMDPKNQMDDIKMKIPTEAKRKEVLEKLLISDECIEILERPNKSKKDYFDFLEARFKMLLTKLAIWDFTLGEEDYQDETADEVI